MLQAANTVNRLVTAVSVNAKWRAEGAEPPFEWMFLDSFLTRDAVSSVDDRRGTLAYIPLDDNSGDAGGPECSVASQIWAHVSYVARIKGELVVALDAEPGGARLVVDILHAKNVTCLSGAVFGNSNATVLSFVLVNACNTTLKAVLPLHDVAETLIAAGAGRGNSTLPSWSSLGITSYVHGREGSDRWAECPDVTASLPWDRPLSPERDVVQAPSSQTFDVELTPHSVYIMELE